MSVPEKTIKEMLRDGALLAAASVAADVKAITPLPEPTVTFADARKGTLDSSDVSGVLHNPIYAGFGPFPAITSDEEWIATAIKLMEEEGQVQFLVNMLAMLRETFSEVEGT